MGRRNSTVPRTQSTVDAAPPPNISPLRPSPVYDSYWRFAAERQRVFFNRLERRPPPWTYDPVLQAHKFTNPYRASDRVSQYLIHSVIYRDDLPTDPVEVVFRILLFKLFNRIETWQLLEQSVGPLTWDEYSFKRYDQVLSRAMAKGQKIYAAAYIMPSGGTLGHEKKHRNHLTLIERMIAGDHGIAILRLPSDAPLVRLSEGAQQMADRLGITGWLVSISHSGDLAMASAIAVSE
ncbi:MAG TPA: nucleotide kinase domain-containing protein [Gemmataceae bacterium]|jgi:hypothetical protein